MNRVRVVLVRGEIAANIGAVARVMRNLGVEDLTLVSPVADHLSKPALQLATHHATEVLERARVVSDLKTALEDCIAAAATSARTGGLFRKQTVGPPEEIAASLSEALSIGPIALVFGPESHGLTNDEIRRCQSLIHIPTSEEYSALNLAQAVAICLYQVRRAWQTRSNEVVEETATLADQQRMFDRLEQALREVRYLRGVRGDALMHALRYLIGRARPSPMEVRLLLGLARQLRWVAARTRFDESDAHEE